MAVTDPAIDLAGRVGVARNFQIGDFGYAANARLHPVVINVVRQLGEALGVAERAHPAVGD